MTKNEGAPRRKGKQVIVDEPNHVPADKEVKDGAAESDDEETGAATLQMFPVRVQKCGEDDDDSVSNMSATENDEGDDDDQDMGVAPIENICKPPLNTK